jgi:choline-sulfatase
MPRSNVQSTQPNILFLFLDQWRWDWIGGLGKVPVRTPHIDALMRRGVNFTQCRTNSPLCGPARACLAQGMRYHHVDVPANNWDMDPDRPTFFHTLRGAGYQVGTIGKNDLHKRTKWAGLEGWTSLLGRYGFTCAIELLGTREAARAGGLDKGGPRCPWTAAMHREGCFHLYADDFQRRLHELTLETAAWASPLPRHLHSDEFCGRAAIELLGRFPIGAPWFHWVNFAGPHDPPDPAADVLARYEEVQFPPPVQGCGVYRDKPVDHQRVRRAYAAKIELIDEWIGRIIDFVAQRGELDRTHIILTADHGEMLGDHGRFMKHVALEGSIHVPLLISGPGLPRGTTSNALVELIDVGATFLDLAGLPPMSGVDAKSLLPVMLGQREDHEHRQFQTAQLNLGARSWRMIFDGRFKFISTRHHVPAANLPTEELYDLLEDPGETTNCAVSDPNRVRRFADQLDAELGTDWDANSAQTNDPPQSHKESVQWT